RVLKLFGVPPALLERAHDGRAPCGLNRHHARPLTPNPAQRLHLLERLPHADESGASARRVDDPVRQFPFELLGHLVAESLLALDAVRLLQSRNVEPAFGVLATSDLRAAVSYQTVEERDVRSCLLALDDVSARRIFRHEDVRF